MPINLADEIARALQEYTDDVTVELDDVKDTISKEAVSELRATSPKRTGDYAKGWSRKKTAHGYVVYNRTDYQLTHLLEYGHAKRNGGRVRAYPHIAPVEQKVIDKFTNATEKAVKG
ncbi:HK97 gp10 family phage protein [Sporolactobacillus sp. CQH2019]|uniref:HK97 gp10 family phage protein n=1 Tax=Sporolactobacillus sp. CQH2019 TaxID=3023512 RepID=UPI002368899E|nr:HK97 gp10 family phage protein [Sporolactobacillus sp. CQH2019]MDD9149257.1 HK97 gp10 family phage protein [Sporolactobacillus sp. CQH2019]